MHSVDHKHKAVALRRLGYSYGHIEQKLGVSKSTLSIWLRNISYHPNSTTHQRIEHAQKAIGEFQTKRKKDSAKAALTMANEYIGVLSDRDIFLLGLGIYIGEGSKTKSVIRVVNADPRIIRFSMRWFEKIFSAVRSDFSLAIHLYPEHDIPRTLAFWSKFTNIPISQFGKTQIDDRPNKKVAKQNKHSWGTAHLTVRTNGKRVKGATYSELISAWMDWVLADK